MNKKKKMKVLAMAGIQNIISVFKMNLDLKVPSVLGQCLLNHKVFSPFAASASLLITMATDSLARLVCF